MVTLTTPSAEIPSFEELERRHAEGSFGAGVGCGMFLGGVLGFGLAIGLGASAYAFHAMEEAYILLQMEQTTIEREICAESISAYRLDNNLIEGQSKTPRDRNIPEFCIGLYQR